MQWDRFAQAKFVDLGGHNTNHFPAIAGPPIGLRRNSLCEHGTGGLGTPARSGISTRCRSR